MPLESMLNNSTFQSKSREEQEQLYTWALEKDLKKMAGFRDLYSDDDIRAIAARGAQKFKPVIPGKELVQLTDADRQRFEQARTTPVNAVPTAIAGALAGSFAGLPGMILGALGAGKVIERINRGDSNDDEIKYAYWLGEKAASGDKDAIREIKAYTMQKETVAQSLIGKAQALGKDAAEFLFMGDKDLDIGLNRKTRETMAEYLYRQLPIEEQTSASTMARIAGGAFGLGELAALSMATGGTAAVPGMFTKGAFAAAKAGVAGTTGLTRLFWKGAQSFGIESLVSGAVDAIRTLPETLQQGKYTDKNSSVKDIATNFGVGMAFDIVANLGMDALRIVAKPAIKVLFGKRLDLAGEEAQKAFVEAVQGGNKEFVEKTLQSIINNDIDPSVLARLDPEGKEELLQAAARFKNISSKKILKVDSDEFVPLWAKASGYDAELSNGKFSISRGGNVIEDGLSRSEAINYVSANRKFAIESSEFFEYKGQETSQLKSRVRGKIDINEVPTDALTAITMSTDQVGRVNPMNVNVSMKNLLKRSDSALDSKTIDSLKTRRLSEETFRKNVQNIPEMLKKSPDTILMPATMLEPTTQEMFGNYLTAFGKSKSSQFGNVLQEFTTKHVASEEGLKLVSKQLDNGVLLKDKDTWILNYTDPSGGNVSEKFFSLAQANEGVNTALIKTGKMDESEVIASIFEDTGVKIVPKDSGDQFSKYEARDFRGHLLATGDSLADIIAQRPNLSPRFPQRMGPQMYFVDKIGTVDIQRTVATGPFNDILKLSDGFKGSRVPSTWKTIEFSKDSTVKLSTHGKFTNRYAVAVDDVGFTTEFASLKEARKFMADQDSSWTNIKSLAASRGYDLATTGTGKIGITNFEGRSTIVDNLEKAKLYLQQSPISQSHMNLVTAFDDPIDDQIINKARTVLEELDPEMMKPKFMQSTTQDGLTLQAEHLKSHSIVNAIDEVISPAYSAMEEMGKRIGAPEIPLKAEQYGLRLRKSAAQTLKGNRIVNSIFTNNGKLIDKKTAEALGELFEVDPKMWNAKAEAIGFKILPEHEKMLRAARQYTDHMGDVFGIDAYRYLTNYSPKMRRSISELIDENGIENLTKNAILEKSFGKNWRANKEVSFFAKNMRNETFLDVVKNQTNIVDQLAFYTEQGYRELNLGKFLSGIEDWRVATLSKVKNLDNTVADRVTEFYDVVTGSGSGGDWTQRMVSLKSYQLTKGFSDSVKKVFGDKLKPLTDWAESQITTDLPGKASAMLTHATLNFRPFRGVANLFQYMNSYAAFGNKALESVIDVSDANIERYLSKGIISKNMLTTTDSGMQGSIGRLLEKGLKGQQSSEFLTRAWTARSAEASFDESLERLANRVIDLKGFLSESRVNIMDDTAVAETLRLIKEGTPEAARDLFATQAVRILMFDYAKENYPMAFKGVVGKMFGKFGVFPVGQVDLYRRILRTGGTADKALIAARLVASSVIVYNAFRMAGVDYSGFQMGDAFGFSGGPLYRTMQDAMAATGSGPEASLARGNLARSFLPGIDKETGAFQVPRLVVPGALQINAIFKATKLIDNDLYRASIVALGAPYRKDWVRNGPMTW